MMPDAATTYPVDYDAIGEAVAIASKSSADAAADTVSDKVDEQTTQLENRIETSGYEQTQELRTVVEDSVGASTASILAAMSETETDGVQSVTLDATQWEALTGALRTSVACSLASVMVCALCMGVLVFQVFVEGWRRR